ncbi:MAG: SDR family oxidoreductase [Pseudomonadota bacterium]
MTGVASGIGRALALKAASLGMMVAGCDRDAAGLDALRATLDARGTPHALRIADVTDAEDMARLAEAVSAMPPVALLFANAGLLRKGAVLDLSLDDWRTLLSVNVFGVVNTLQALVPAMIASGVPAQVVVTGSTASMVTAPGLAAYCATKHALWPMVEALRDELDGTAVGASLLMPGAVATGIFATIDPNRARPADSIEPEDLADVAFAGALADAPKILTHPAYADRARARFEAVLDEISPR